MTRRLAILLALSLLSCGEADMTAGDPFAGEDEKAVAIAVARGDGRTVTSLLSAERVSPHVVGENGANLLSTAIRAGRLDMLRLLLDAGALSDPASPRVGNAMYTATVADDPRYLEVLHGAGAALDNTGGGVRLLLAAARTKLPGRLDYYIANGADLDIRTFGGETAALDCTKTVNYPAVLALLDAGASPWAASSRGHGIGFWLERVATRAAWAPTAETVRHRARIVERLRAAGVPHPPPAPDDVVRMMETGAWRWTP